VALNRRSLGALAAAAALALPVHAQDKSIVVASTTSTEQSGLFGHILPMFTKKTGIAVKVVALGTGQALEVGRRGDADVVFVHDRAAEDKFVAEGFGVDRRDVMYNDFVLVGPKSDPAKVAGGKDVAAALKAIAAAKAPFVSRGDNSGTHAAELRYFKDAGVDPNEGKGLQRLLNQTRFEVARQLLRNTRLPVAEIAATLQYADANAFSRAFRQWAKCSPSAWRAEQEIGMTAG
jgi:tungstate transport system substrate-binding protein